MKKIEIFTDGACRGNPGPGGWGALLCYNGHTKELYGAAKETTNNRMELTAAVMALNAVKQACQIEITTDSTYVKNGITQWIHNWKKRGWKTTGKKPVKNADLWQQLEEAIESHQVSWHWVKGHSGHIENEQADLLANKAIDKMLQGD